MAVLRFFKRFAISKTRDNIRDLNWYLYDISQCGNYLRPVVRTHVADMNTALAMLWYDIAIVFGATHDEIIKELQWQMNGS